MKIVLAALPLLVVLASSAGAPTAQRPPIGAGLKEFVKVDADVVALKEARARLAEVRRP